eukprot:3674316-Prymnesium_polylepis.1
MAIPATWCNTSVLGARGGGSTGASSLGNSAATSANPPSRDAFPRVLLACARLAFGLRGVQGQVRQVLSV